METNDSRTSESIAGTGFHVGDRVQVRGLTHPPGPATVLGLYDGTPPVRRRGPRPLLVRLGFRDREMPFEADRLMPVEAVSV